LESSVQRCPSNTEYASSLERISIRLDQALRIDRLSVAVRLSVASGVSARLDSGLCNSWEAHSSTARLRLPVKANGLAHASIHQLRAVLTLPGYFLVLVPEPTNKFDPGAVKICRRNGEQIGGDGRMANDLAIGWTYRLTIDQICPFHENPKNHGVRLRVEVLTMSRKTEERKQKDSDLHPAKHSRTAKGTMKVIDPSTGRMECAVCGARHYADEGTYGRWQCLYGCTKTADGLVKRPLEKPAEREGVTTEEEVEHVRKEYNLNHLKNSRHPLDKGKT
jgi:hypothetical protein